MLLRHFFLDGLARSRDEKPFYVVMPDLYICQVGAGIDDPTGRWRLSGFGSDPPYLLGKPCQPLRPPFGGEEGILDPDDA